MKRVLKFISISVIVLLIAFVGGAYLLPQHVTVERDVVIDAPPQEVFVHLNSFENFNEWSPWAKLDPDTKYTYKGPKSGVGARMEWTSDDPNVGNGTQEIITSEPYSLVESNLDFGTDGTAVAYYKLDPQDGATDLTWGLRADMGNNPIGRWMGLAMDSMVGADYEKGLASLKKLIESKE